MTKLDIAQNLLEEAGHQGMTWRELAATMGTHHGAASAALSRLHHDGIAMRLVEKREGCGIYVRPAFLEGRETKAPRVGKVNADAFAEGEAAGRAYARAEAEAAIAEATREAAARADAAIAEAVRTAEADIERARRVGYADGQNDAEADWQAGYDEALKRAESSDTFAEGREMGRREGEDAVRRQIARVGGEIYRVIWEHAPVRTHFRECYLIHPECAARAVAAGAGVTLGRRGEARLDEVRRAAV